MARDETYMYFVSGLGGVSGGEGTKRLEEQSQVIFEMLKMSQGHCWVYYVIFYEQRLFHERQCFGQSLYGCLNRALKAYS